MDSSSSNLRRPRFVAEAQAFLILLIDSGWLMTPHALLIACGVFTILAILFIVAAAVSAELSLVDLGAPIALFSAVAGFLFNSAVKLHSEARDRAFEFVKQHSEQKEL